jgi:hypothetical protein
MEEPHEGAAPETSQDLAAEQSAPALPEAQDSAAASATAGKQLGHIRRAQGVGLHVIHGHTSAADGLLHYRERPLRNHLHASFLATMPTHLAPPSPPHAPSPLFPADAAEASAPDAEASAAAEDEPETPAAKATEPAAPAAVAQQEASGDTPLPKPAAAPAAPAAPDHHHKPADVDSTPAADAGHKAAAAAAATQQQQAKAAPKPAAAAAPAVHHADEEADVQEQESTHKVGLVHSSLLL